MLSRVISNEELHNWLWYVIILYDYAPTPLPSPLPNTQLHVYGAWRKPIMYSKYIHPNLLAFLNELDESRYLHIFLCLLFKEKMKLNL